MYFPLVWYVIHVHQVYMYMYKGLIMVNILCIIMLTIVRPVYMYLIKFVEEVYRDIP